MTPTLASWIFREGRARLRATYRALRRLKLTRDGITSRSALHAIFESLGVTRGGTVFLHASTRALGYVAGGPDAVCRALADTVGPHGTIVMPSFSHSGSMEEHVASRPSFDVRSTPSASGAISEAFRSLPGVVRSLHPTHSFAALGPLAHDLLDAHASVNSPCGVGSPLDKLCATDGLTLRLGTGALTLFHHAQELSEHPLLFTDQGVTLPCTDASGVTRFVDTRVYRKSIPSVLYVDWPPETEAQPMHWRDYPLLHPGDREQRLRRTPGAEATLHGLLRLRNEYARTHFHAIVTLPNGIADAFRASEWRKFAIPRLRTLLTRHQALYTADILEACLRDRGIA